MHTTHGFVHRPFVLTDFSSPPARKKAEFMPAFDKPEAQEVAAPPPPPPEPEVPAITEAELAAARAEGEEAGYRRGREEATQALEARLVEQNERIAQLLEGLMERMTQEVAAYHAARDEQRDQVVNIALMVARKLAGSALETQPLGAVEGMVTECLNMLSGVARLSIVVSPETEAPLRTHLESLQREGRVVELSADPKMQPGDCRIEWPGGKAERDQAQLQKEMEAIVTRALSSPRKNV